MSTVPARLLRPWLSYILILKASRTMHPLLSEQFGMKFWCLSAFSIHAKLMTQSLKNSLFAVRINCNLPSRVFSIFSQHLMYIH